MVSLRKGGYATIRVGYDNETGEPRHTAVKVLSKPCSGEVNDEIFAITGRSIAANFKQVVFVKHLDSLYDTLEDRKYNNQWCRKVHISELTPVLKNQIQCLNQ